MAGTRATGSHMKELLKESHLKPNQQTNMMLEGQLSSAQGASDSGHCAHEHSSMESQYLVQYRYDSSMSFSFLIMTVVYYFYFNKQYCPKTRFKAKSTGGEEMVTYPFNRRISETETDESL